MRISRLLFSVCAALALQAPCPAFAGPPLPATPPGADSVSPEKHLEQARDLYRKGLEAYKKRDWQTACDRFAASWAIKQHYQIAGNLGACSMKLERYVDAAKFITVFLRELPSGETPDSRASAQTDLAVATTKIGTLRLSVFESTPAPTVWVDGTLVGRAPLPDSLFIAPGHHLVEVRLDDGRSERKEIDAKAGESQELRIERTAASEAVPIASPSAVSPAAPVPVPPAPESRRSVVPVVVGLGLTATGLALGIGFTVAANSKTLYLDGLRADIATRSGSASSGCSQPRPDLVGECDDLAVRLDSQATLRSVATVAFIGAGVAAVGTGIYLLWPRSKASKANAAGQTLRVAAGPLSLGVEGTW